MKPSWASRAYTDHALPNALSAFSLVFTTSALLGQTEEDCVIQVGDFRTQTQGGWGADECSGDNPACTLQALFDGFPGGRDPRRRVSRRGDVDVHDRQGRVGFPLRPEKHPPCCPLMPSTPSREAVCWPVNCWRSSCRSDSMPPTRISGPRPSAWRISCSRRDRMPAGPWGVGPMGRSHHRRVRRAGHRFARSDGGVGPGQ